MDPFSALGAASSAIGIAGFALDLAVGLFKVAGQMRSARDSINRLGKTVQATGFALQEIESLLKDEEDLFQTANKLRIFSIAALMRVKDTTSQCLIILWKIEAAAVRSEEPGEEDLAKRLAARERSSSSSEKPTVILHSSFYNPSPGVWDRFVFALSTSDKLKEYGIQLQELQASLSLIFHIATLKYLMNKSSLTATERDAMTRAQDALHRPRPKYQKVAHSLIHGQDTSQKLQPGRQIPRTDAMKTNDHSTVMAAQDLGRTTEPVMHKPVQASTARKSSSTASADNVHSTVPSVTARVTDVPGEVASYAAQRSQDGNEAGTYVSRKSTSVSNVNGQEKSDPDSQEVHNPMRVYTVQRFYDKSVKKERVLFAEENMTQAEILKRLNKLDRGPLTPLDKKLSLGIAQQRDVDFVENQINNISYGNSYWTLRQLERERSRLNRLRASWGMLTIIVYFQRQKGDHRAVRRWQHTQTEAAARDRADYKLQTVMRERLLAAGVPEHQIPAMIDGRRPYFMMPPPPPPPPPMMMMDRGTLPPLPPMHHHSHRAANATHTSDFKKTYTRMSRKHLSLEALRARQIDFELDRNPEYVIIKRWVPEDEQDDLWSLSKLIRGDRERVTTTLTIQDRSRHRHRGSMESSGNMSSRLDSEDHDSPPVHDDTLKLKLKKDRLHPKWAAEERSRREHGETEQPRAKQESNANTEGSLQSDRLDDATIAELISLLTPAEDDEGGNEQGHIFEYLNSCETTDG